jgi:antirestriction protein ArdC
MENGALPWQREWNGENRVPISLPSNATTLKPYRGINVLLLWAHSRTLGRQHDMRFLTFKQALDCGGNVRKGEHGTKIYFFRDLEIEDKKTGEKRKVPMLREYTVFHITQTENCAFAEINGETAILPDDTAEFCAATGANITHGGDDACYMPGPDLIIMPYPQDFVSIDTYRSVLYHEIIHWTGHAKRAKRNFGLNSGSIDYAKEELVAEIGAAFICAEFGIQYSTRHANYLSKWIKCLNDDKKAIFQAASLAQKAVDYIRQAVISEPIKEAA